MSSKPPRKKLKQSTILEGFTRQSGDSGCEKQIAHQADEEKSKGRDL